MRHDSLFRRIKSVLMLTVFCSYSSAVFASAFQLWEQDGASIGNVHAGYAAAAEDASTAFYNPAGLTRFDHQQLVFGGASVLTNFKYKGTVAISTLSDPNPQPVTAQGGGFGFVPQLNFVAPLTDSFAFGFSVVVPFGLETNYGRDTILQYVATQTSIQVIDISPVLAVKLNKATSAGIGLDVQIARGEFDQVGVLFEPRYYADGINTANDTGYGFHAGVLYDVSDKTRVGLSYHSQVVHHLTGDSSLNGPLLELGGSSGVNSTTARLNITLPPYTALSGFHQTNNYAVMASAIFTQWSTIQQLVLQNVAGIQGGNPTDTLVVTIPQHFRNTWNVSVGGNYYLTDTVTLRGGLGYDQTPTNDTYRNVQLPDNDRYVVGLGAQFKLSKTIAFDASWNHIFVPQSRITPPTQVTGDEQATTSGHVRGGADVFGVQVTWNLT